MNFKQISLDNIFAYRGENVVDLTDCKEERNIVVVTGHNGAGKTSFLNAIKLLFLGSDDDKLRRVGFGQRILSRNQYILGGVGRWYGVLNRQARQDGETTARISLEWEENGRDVRATRSFHFGTNTYDEVLEIQDDGRLLSSDDARQRLAHLLPKDVVPFFFFDGEQIQSLADAEVGREATEIERLLGLSFVAELARQLETLIKERRRAAMPEDIRHRMLDAESRMKVADSKRVAAAKARQDLESEILELEGKKRRLEQQMNELRGGISEEERAKLQRRIELIELDREQLARKIAQELPPEAPFLINTELVEEAFQVLDSYQGQGGTGSTSRRLSQDLPIRVLDRLRQLRPPVDLDAERTATLIDAIRIDLVDLLGEKREATHPLLVH